MNKPRDCKKFIEMMEKSEIILIKRYHNKKIRKMLFEIYPVLNEMPKIPIVSFQLSTRVFNKNPKNFYQTIYHRLFKTDPNEIEYTFNASGYWEANRQIIYENFENVKSSIFDETYTFENDILYYVYKKYHSDFNTCKFITIRKCIENSKTLDEFKVNCVLNGIELVN